MSLKQDVLDHYDRMIAWAETQNPRSKVNSDEMRICISEWWYSDDCPLCKTYQNEFSEDCVKCPVYKKSKNYYCRGTPWIKMDDSKTWKTWLKYAKLEREFLESLDYGEENEIN